MNGWELVIGTKYRYTEWDSEKNYVDCIYLGNKDSLDGILYEFKYIDGNGSFVTLYPSKLIKIN